MTKQFLGLLENKHLQKEISENMGYRENDIDILKPMLYKKIAEEALNKALLAAYDYDITERKENLSNKVIVTFGGNEVFSKDSALLRKEKCINDFSIKEMYNMEYSEAISLHPDLSLDLIRM